MNILRFSTWFFASGFILASSFTLAIEKRLLCESVSKQANEVISEIQSLAGEQPDNESIAKALKYSEELKLGEHFSGFNGAELGFYYRLDAWVKINAKDYTGAIESTKMSLVLSPRSDSKERMVEVSRLLAASYVSKQLEQTHQWLLENNFIKRGLLQDYVLDDVIQFYLKVGREDLVLTTFNALYKTISERYEQDYLRGHIYTMLKDAGKDKSAESLMMNLDVEDVSAYAAALSSWYKQQSQLVFKREAPEYPTRAAMAGSAGCVMTKFDVNEKGEVINIVATEHVGHSSLITSSIQAAKKFKFPTYTHVDGTPASRIGVENFFLFFFTK
jgi:TonB family protein